MCACMHTCTISLGCVRGEARPASGWRTASDVVASSSSHVYTHAWARVVFGGAFPGALRPGAAAATTGTTHVLMSRAVLSAAGLGIAVVLVRACTACLSVANNV